MRLSFFCTHCQKHLRSGDHTACKKILREQRGEEKEKPDALKKRYLDGTSGKYLADKDRFE